MRPWTAAHQVANIVDALVAAVSVTSTVLLVAGLETKTEMLLTEMLVIGVRALSVRAQQFVEPRALGVSRRPCFVR